MIEEETIRKLNFSWPMTSSLTDFSFSGVSRNETCFALIWDSVCLILTSFLTVDGAGGTKLKVKTDVVGQPEFQL